MYTVLLVDDEDSIRKALKHAVDWNELGFQILEDVTNGIEALDYIEKYDIDLLVTDIKMPIMGGIELARAAREIRPSMQIVFLSGHDEFDFAKQAIKYNILEYLLKPITDEQIIREFTSIKEKLDNKFSEILNIDDHQDTVKDLQHARRELFIAKLVNNGLTKLQVQQFFDGNESAKELVGQGDKQYVLFVVKNDNSVQDEEAELRNRRLYNVTKIISEKYLKCICSIYADYNIVIACESKATLDKFMPILSKDIILSAKRVINMKTFFIQSEYYYDIRDTYKAFQQITEALPIAEKTDEQIVQTSDLKESLKDRNHTIQSLKTAMDNISQKSIEIIKKEYGNPDINLAYLANKVHCSPNYLSSIIKKTTGESFVDILTKVRMEKADALLRSTDKKIREIAEDCGYANQHYFSYSFKKYYDKSPNTVRKEVIEGRND